jgi:hypothetical protein
MTDKDVCKNPHHCTCCGEDIARWICNDGCGHNLCDDCIRHYAWSDTGPMSDRQAKAAGFKMIDKTK